MSHPTQGVPVRRVRVPTAAAAWGRLDAILRDLTGDVRALVVEFEPVAVVSEEFDAGVARSRVCAALARPDLVSIAVLRDAAGADVAAAALACDLRLLGDHATLQFCDAGVFGALHRLRDLVGPARALELCLTGRRLSAAQAADIGLASAVLPADQVDGAVDDLLAAVLSTPRAWAAEIKAAISSSGPGSVGRRIADELDAVRRLASEGE